MRPSLLSFLLAFLLIGSCRPVSLRSVSDNAQQPPMRTVYRTSIQEHFPFKNDSIKQLIPIIPPLRTSFRADSTVRYSILSGDDDGYFRINELNGDLYLMRQLDRESLPESAVGDRFSLVIQATEGAKSTQTRLIVDVEDVNDNRPRFPSNEQFISIVENLPVGFNVLQVTASDPDLGENGRFTFRLIDPSGAFTIDPITGWISVSNSTLLDRERVDRMILMVETVEHVPSLVPPDPSKSTSYSSVQIDIELTDSNDNSPIFQPTNLYTFKIDATAETGTVVGQVEAFDADANENGRVVYAIQYQQEGEPTTGRESFGTHPIYNQPASRDFQQVPFSIHPRSGHLIVTDAPLTKKSYTVFVEASDQPPNQSEQRHSLAVVQISVLSSESDSSVAKFSQMSYQFWVAVFTPMDTAIGQVKTDGFPDPKKVRYTLKYRPRKPVPFSLDPRTGILRVAGDLTLPASYTFNVTASDGYKNSITTTLTVHVLGEPMASSSTLPLANNQMFTVTENSPAGYLGQLIYPVTNEASRIEFIPVDPKATAMDYLILLRNGSVYTRRPMDRELIQTNLTLFVTVLDNGYNRDTIHLTVIITDVNDNAPVFSYQQYFGLVAENVAAGTRVQLSQRISASDADAWPNNIVRFSLVGNGSHHFVIDTETAEISVLSASSLDRERRSFYNLTVTASDGVYSSRAELDILIDDVNDNPPHISGFVPTIGVVALERSADRQDLSDEGLIIICADGSCSAPIDFEEKEPKQLAPGRMLATYSRFRNHLLRFLDDWIDIAERSLEQTPPTEDEILERAFQEILYNSSILVQVPDDFPVDGTIGVFKTSDQDNLNPLDQLNQLRFGLRARKSHQDYFVMDPESGSLFLKKPLRSEEVYHIGVQVSDEQGLRSETSIAIQSADVNKHRPSFNRSFYELFVPEGDYNNTAFVSIEAIDEDFGESGRLSYSLISPTRSPFSIEEKTGTLLITGSLDREETEFYRFSVQASDAGFPPLKSRVEVVVYVTDVNDNAPRFDLPVGRNREKGLQPLFTVTLTEGTPPGTAVVRVRATDADADVHTNSNVTYRLGSHQHLFTIDPISGSIFTTEKVKRSSSEPDYNLLVVATDGGIPRLSTAGVVRIKVAEACQPDPAGRRQQSVTLDENVPTPIALVNLTSNRPRREMVHLSLLRIEPSSPEAQSLFRLDDSEPVLWLTEPLDREVLDAYSVHLRVQHIGLERRTGEGNCTGIEEEELVLNIRVADVNDNPPVFAEKSPVVVAVPSSAPVGYSVISLLAVDADDGSNGVIKFTMTMSQDELGSSEEIDPLEGMSLFFIESRNGSISVASAIDRLTGHILRYQIRATDRNGNGLSSSLDLAIHIVDRSHEVALLFASPQQILLSQLENITQIVSEVSGLNVWIKSVEPHFVGNAPDSTMTDVVLYAKSQTSKVFVTSDELTRALNQKWDELEQKMPNRLKIKEIRQPNRNIKSLPASPHAKLDALEVTLIAMGAAVLLGALVAVLCIVMTRVSHKKRSRLVPSPVSMAMDYHHVQQLKNATTSSCNDSSQMALMSGGSSGSSEIYIEVPGEKSHPFYRSPVQAAQHQVRCYQPAMVTSVCCHSCQPHETKRCQCLNKHTAELSNHLSGSDNLAMRPKNESFCHLHSTSPSCRVLHRQTSRAVADDDDDDSGRIHQLDALQLVKLMRQEPPGNYGGVRFKTEKKRRISQIHTKAKQRRCQHHGRRRNSPPSTSVAQVHRRETFSEPAMEFNRRKKISTESSSTTETFDDSLKSLPRHQKHRRRGSPTK